MATIINIARANVTCPRCGAGPGQQCTSSTGKRARYLHLDRTEGVSIAYYEGFVEGIKDAVENPGWAAQFVEKS